MPEPTDHRAEAEDFLERAAETPEQDWELAVGRALIGIGHALLAGLLEPVQWESPPYTRSVGGDCPRCGRSDHDETAHEAARTRIEERFGMTPEGPQEPE